MMAYPKGDWCGVDLLFKRVDEAEAVRETVQF